MIVTARKSLRRFWIETTADFVPGTDNTDGLQISVIYPDFSRALPLGHPIGPGATVRPSPFSNASRLTW